MDGWERNYSSFLIVTKRLEKLAARASWSPAHQNSLDPVRLLIYFGKLLHFLHISRLHSKDQIRPKVFVQQNGSCVRCLCNRQYSPMCFSQHLWEAGKWKGIWFQTGVLLGNLDGASPDSASSKPSVRLSPAIPTNVSGSINILSIYLSISVCLHISCSSFRLRGCGHPHNLWVHLAPKMIIEFSFVVASLPLMTIGNSKRVPSLILRSH